MNIFNTLSYSAGFLNILKKYNCYYLLDLVIIHLQDPDMKKIKFKIWLIKIELNILYLTITDSEGNILKDRQIESRSYSNEDLHPIKFYLQNETLFMPEEYDYIR